MNMERQHGTPTSSREKRWRFARVAALVFTLAVFGMPYAQAQGMMGGGGGMGMMGRRTGALPHNAPKALSQYGCLSCHAVDSARAGPAFAWVAWKYRGKGNALASVSAFIEHGGTGSWGGVMPNLHVPADQARRIARWILSLPPESPRGGAAQASP